MGPPTAYRPAPAPPTPLTPALDRSTSQRLPASKPPKSADQLTRANTTRDRRSPVPGHPSTHPHGQHPHASQHVPGSPPQTHASPKAKSSPGSNAGDLPSKSAAESGPRRQPSTQQPPSAAAQSLQKVATTGGATPRRREKKGDKDKEADIVNRLKQICTDADPTKLYRSLVKIGAGYVSAVSVCELVY